MIERLVDNWLDSASERAFQIPYCQILLAEGYTVVHLSRHCAMEMGKDILAIDSQGVPCAFQLKSLKGQKVSLSKYRSDIEPQLLSLALGKIIHPAINSNVAHRSILVINGELEEEVSRSIDDFNRARTEDGTNRTIEVVVKGQLVEKFKTLGTDFWPLNPVDVRLMLELYLSDPRGQLPKEKYHQFLTTSILDSLKESRREDNFRKSAIAAGILSSYAIAQFVDAQNHFAEFEMWVMYTSYMITAASRCGLAESSWKDIYDLCTKNILNALMRILDETKNRSQLVEGDAFTDHHALRVRTTLMLGLVSLLGIRTRRLVTRDEAVESLASEFVKSQVNKIFLWGEYAVPQFLACYLYLRMIDATPRPAFLLLSVLQGIVKQNTARDGLGLPNAYYDWETIFPHLAGIADEKLGDSFRGNSNTAEGILHLAVRTNWKQHIKLEWSNYTRLAITEFAPKEADDLFVWRCETGTHRTKLCPHTKHWDDLKAEALEHQGKDLPKQLKEDPFFYLCFLIVYPHRFTSSGARWVATAIPPD